MNTIFAFLYLWLIACLSCSIILKGEFNDLNRICVNGTLGSMKINQSLCVDISTMHSHFRSSEEYSKETSKTYTTNDVIIPYDNESMGVESFDTLDLHKVLVSNFYFFYTSDTNSSYSYQPTLGFGEGKQSLVNQLFLNHEIDYKTFRFINDNHNNRTNETDDDNDENDDIVNIEIGSRLEDTTPFKCYRKGENTQSHKYGCTWTNVFKFINNETSTNSSNSFKTDNLNVDNHNKKPKNIPILPNKKDKNLNVIFDSLSYNIHFPIRYLGLFKEHYFGKEFFSNHCKVMDDFQRFYVYCDKEELLNIPPLHLVFGNIDIIIKASDLFLNHNKDIQQSIFVIRFYVKDEDVTFGNWFITKFSMGFNEEKKQSYLYKEGIKGNVNNIEMIEVIIPEKDIINIWIICISILVWILTIGVVLWVKHIKINTRVKPKCGQFYYYQEEEYFYKL